MGVVRVKLIKEYKGTPAGEYIQVLDELHKHLMEIGVCADPDPELKELKKKSKKNPDVSDVNE